MVLTAAAQTTVFTDPSYIGLTVETRTRLTEEDVTSVDSISNFTPEDVKELAQTMRCLGANQGPFAFGAMTQKRFNDTAELLRFYQTTGRALTIAIPCWQTIGQDFEKNGSPSRNGRRRDKVTS